MGLPEPPRHLSQLRDALACLCAGGASQGSLFGDTDDWSGTYRDLHRSGRAFAELDDITGISARVFGRWIELNVPDTDLAAWVYEIRPTGKTIYLGQTALRVRYRNGVNTASLAKPGTVERYRFDRVYWTSRQIQKGSRIRLVIAPLNDPERQKNYNSGVPPPQETVEDAQTATVELHMGPDPPSAFTLPVRADDGS